MIRDTIEWQGKEFPAVHITIFEGTEDEKDVMVATTDLENELLPHIELESSHTEADSVDESICYYLEPDEINLSEEEIVKVVEASYS